MCVCEVDCFIFSPLETHPFENMRLDKVMNYYGLYTKIHCMRRHETEVHKKTKSINVLIIYMYVHNVFNIDNVIIVYIYMYM